MAYDANGKPTTENYKVALIHDTPEYWNFLKMLRANGYVKVDVEFVLNLDSPNKEKPFEYDEIEDVSQYVKEVSDAFDDGTKPVLTADQKRIADLEAKLEALMSGKTNAPASESTDIELESARQAYIDLTGSQGDKRWTIETIYKKIEEFKTAK